MGGCPNRWGATCLRRNLALRAAQGKKLILGAILFNSKELRRKKPTIPNQNQASKISHANLQKKMPPWKIPLKKKWVRFGRGKCFGAGHRSTNGVRKAKKK